MPMIQFDLRLKSFIPVYREASFEGALAIFSAFTCGFQITCNSFPSAVSDGRKQEENCANRNNITSHAITSGAIY